MMPEWELDLLIEEATLYVLTHPCEKYDVDLLRLLFPRTPVLDNFGFTVSLGSDDNDKCDKSCSEKTSPEG